MQEKEVKPIYWKADGKIFRIQHSGLTVCVHNYVGCGDQLYVSCPELDISTRELKSTSLPEARIEALRFIESYTQKLVKTASELVIRAKEPQ